MNAGTRLVAMISLLWALTAIGGAGSERTEPSYTRDRPGGCDEWGCGTNHNETMVRDAASARQAEPWSRWLARALAFVYTNTRGGCDDWGCGTNHNETMVRDAAR